MIFFYTWLHPLRHVAFPPHTCMSLTNQSGAQVKGFPKSDFNALPFSQRSALCLYRTAIIINHKEKSHFSLKPPSSSTISQNPSLKDTNLKHHHHQPSLSISVTWYPHFSWSGENESWETSIFVKSLLSLLSVLIYSFTISLLAFS